jgi:hypothetical protein
MAKWISYPAVPSDGVNVEVDTEPEDIIEYTEFAGHPGIIEIRFSVADNISWWKGLEVKAQSPAGNESGEVIGVLETHDRNREPPALIFDTMRRNMSQHTIFLLKAKMFGVHTGMYWINSPTLETKTGRVLKFRWVADGS